MAIGVPGTKGSAGVKDVFSAENLLLMNETVEEVFGMMLGIEVTEREGAPVVVAATGRPDTSRQEQTAIVGFAGAMSGVCEISVSRAGGMFITKAMMGGMEEEPGSDSICDAVGELCNMLAGGWKNRIPELGSMCSLSVPTVIEGAAYHVHTPASAKRNRRTYDFGGEHVLLLTLLYDPS